MTFRLWRCLSLNFTSRASFLALPGALYITMRQYWSTTPANLSIFTRLMPQQCYNSDSIDVLLQYQCHWMRLLQLAQQSNKSNNYHWLSALTFQDALVVIFIFRALWTVPRPPSFHHPTNLLQTPPSSDRKCQRKLIQIHVDGYFLIV